MMIVAEMNLGERVAQAIWAGIGIGVLIFLWIYLGTPAHDGEPTRWQRLCAWLTNRYLTRPVSSVSILSSDEGGADGQTDEQTDRVSAPYDAIAYLEVDRTRTAIVDTLVRAGWDVGAIRGVLKGDNGAIGAEVAAARERLGITPPPAPPARTLIVHDNGRPEREIVF